MIPYRNKEKLFISGGDNSIIVTFSIQFDDPDE